MCTLPESPTFLMESRHAVVLPRPCDDIEPTPPATPGEFAESTEPVKSSERAEPSDRIRQVNPFKPAETI